MRTLLALILSWLLPSTGKRRATPPANDTPADSPTRRLIIAPSLPAIRSPRPPAYLRGEDVALIRPYLVAHERAHGIYHQEAAA